LFLGLFRLLWRLDLKGVGNSFLEFERDFEFFALALGAALPREGFHVNRKVFFDVGFLKRIWLHYLFNREGLAAAHPNPKPGITLLAPESPAAATASALVRQSADRASANACGEARQL